MTLTPTPSLRDREIANEATQRACVNWIRSTGRNPLPSLDSELFQNLLTAMPAMKSLVVEVEIGIATARLEERERCAKIADKIAEQCRNGPKAKPLPHVNVDDILETAATVIAREIRSDDA